MSMLHIMPHSQEQVSAVFSQIPGLDLLLNSNGNADDQLMEQYPEAAFVYHIVTEPLCHDSEINQIHYETMKAILNRETVVSVQHGYQRKMDQYVQDHLWDA